MGLFIQEGNEVSVVRGTIDCFPFNHVLGRPDLVDESLLTDIKKNEAAINKAMQQMMTVGLTSKVLVLRPDINNAPYLHAAFHPLVEPGLFLMPGDEIVAEVVSHRSYRHVSRPHWLVAGTNVPVPLSRDAFQGTSPLESHYEMGTVTKVLSVNGIPTSPHESVTMRGVRIPGRKIYNDQRLIWPSQGGHDPHRPLPATGFHHWLLLLLGGPLGEGDKYLGAGPTGSGKSTLSRNLFVEVDQVVDRVKAMVGEHEQDIPILEQALFGTPYVSLFAAPVQMPPEQKIRLYELAILRAQRLAERNWYISDLTGREPWPVLFWGDSITSAIQDSLNRKKVLEGYGTLTGGTNPLVPFAAMTVAAIGRRLAGGASLTAFNVVLTRGIEDVTVYKVLRGGTRAALTASPLMVRNRKFPALQVGSTAWTLEGQNKVILPDIYSRSYGAYATSDQVELAAELVNWLNVPEEDEKVRRYDLFLAAARENYEPRPIGDFIVDPMPDAMKAVYEKVGVKKKMIVLDGEQPVDPAYIAKVADYCVHIWGDALPKQGLAEKISTFVVDGQPVSRGVARRVAQRLRNQIGRESRQEAQSGAPTPPRQPRSDNRSGRPRRRSA